MKCQRCDKQAAFHITDLTGDGPVETHLCPACAGEFLQTDQDSAEQSSAMGKIVSSQLPVGQTATQLAELDQKACPICGITFFEFRKLGRLGCPNDYSFFGDELEPLIVNIHGETQHQGKSPGCTAEQSEAFTQMIKLRREMNEAVGREDYELASQIRDEIRRIEKGSPDDT